MASRLTGQLVDVSPTDPASYAFASILIFVAGMSAIMYSARIATMAHPAKQLHGDR